MTLTYFDGFDNNRVAAGPTTVNLDYNSTNQPPSYVTGRGGRGKAMALPNLAPFGSTPSVTWPMPGTTGFAVGAAWYALSCPDNSDFWLFREGATDHLKLRWLGGNIVLMRGDGTTLATSSVPVNILNSSFVHLEVKALVDDTAGAVDVYANGDLVISVSGVDTRNGGATGLVNSWFVYCGNSGLYFDDVWITSNAGPAPYNSRLGNCVVEHLYPAAQGDANAWVGSDGNSTDNWALIDDQSGADYIEGQTVGAKDLSQMADTSPDLGDVLAVQVDTLGAIAATGTPIGPIKSVLKGQGGTEVEEVVAATGSLSTTYAWFKGSIQTADPDGNAWTKARADALQIGVKVG